MVLQQSETNEESSLKKLMNLRYMIFRKKIVNNKITITMLLCKELILIRGQPPGQGGSPRATLDRGEFT